MPPSRTELRDDLIALVAAGRELSPDHDQALAEAFVDRVATGMTRPSRRGHILAVPRKPARLLGAIILALACLGSAQVLISEHAGGTSSTPVQVLPKMPAQPFVGKVPVVPAAPKKPLYPQVPMPKSGP